MGLRCEKGKSEGRAVFTWRFTGVAEVLAPSSVGVVVDFVVVVAALVVAVKAPSLSTATIEV